MNGREPLSVGSVCAECHMWLEPGEVFHPWVYCLLWKNGVDDPEAHLRDLGFVRDPTASLVLGKETTPYPEDGRTRSDYEAFGG